MNLEKYDGLIFDLDGTLLDTDKAHNEAWQQAMLSFGLTFNLALRKKMAGVPTPLMAKAFLEEVNSSVDPEDLILKKNELVQTLLLKVTTELPLVKLLKQQYNKKKMSVGTGGGKNTALKVLEHFDLVKYLDVIVTADDVVNHKPAPDTFLRCAELMNIAPSQCIVFEDGDYGIQAAKAAGMDVIDVRTYCFDF